MTVLRRVWRWLRVGERQLWLEYGLLALIILLPLLGNGYILTLDLVFTPHLAWPQEVTNAYPLQVALWAFYQIMPGEVVEKAVLLIMLLFAGVGMHLLVRQCSERQRTSDAWTVAAYFAGLFYMINPFVYARFMSGQWMVLLGYALLPFFVRALLCFVAVPSWRRTFQVAAWAVVVTTVSLHHVGMIALLGALVMGAGCMSYRRSWRHVKRLLLRGAAAIGIWCLLSSFWLVPTLVGQTSIAQAVGSFDQSHDYAFATLGSNTLGAVSNVIRLQGFWVESQQLFVLPQRVVPAWGIVVLLLWILVGAGMVLAWRNDRLVATLGAGSVTLGVLLAATPILDWAGSILPFVNGYREPHKFVNLVALGYALFGAYGVVYIYHTWQDKEYLRNGVIATALLLPLLITPVMFGGFAGQLTPRQYPKGWEVADGFIRERIGNERALFLPWHQYTAYSFSGRTIANPAAKYFSFPVIASDDPEFKDVPPTMPNQETKRIGKLLATTPSRLAAYLTERRVRYVILAKEQEYASYTFLKSKIYRLVLDNESVKVYEVRHE